MSSRDAPPGPGRRSSADIESTDPPDASGSDAFERFRYQAHLAASVCLATASGEDVQSVVCEHFEDIAIGDSSGWRHIQVKTRNAELGPWKSTDLLKKPGGALSSLFRTYYALSELGEDESCRLEIWLEGVVGRDDDAKVLTGRPVPEDAMANLVQRCSEKFEIPADVADRFLSRVRIADGRPGREVIADFNRALLAKSAPAWTGQKVSETYEKVFHAVEAAMAPERRLGAQFVRVLALPQTASEQARDLFTAKQITRSAVMEMLGDLHDTSILLGLADPATLASTQLEAKLRRAGLSDAVIQDAKQLRADATRRELEIAAATIGDPARQISDVHTRVLTIGNATAALVTSEPPGPEVWDRARTALHDSASLADPRALFGQDSMLLLGELCEISDQCRFAWGRDAPEGMADAA